MEAYSYILKGSSGRFYVGSTNDLENRIKQHKRGHTSTTKRIGNTFGLVFKQKISTLENARAAERKIKKLKRRDYIEKIIKDGKMTSVKL